MSCECRLVRNCYLCQRIGDEYRKVLENVDVRFIVGQVIDVGVYLGPKNVPNESQVG